MPADISGVCSALAAWNGRLDTDSVGALVWREFLGRFTQPNLVDKGSLYAEGFDPLNPLDTPRTLVDAPASGPDPILVALAKAESNLINAGFTVDTSLGAAQFVRMGESTIPIHGGLSIEGTPNIVSFARSGNTTLLPKSKQATIVNGSTSLTQEGYLINSGTSFLLALEYTSDGPHASAVMSYSQSTDPSSPHFADQTQLFSKKSWRPVLFREADIKADPEFVEQRVEGGAQ
jgi:acyl-homoserine-lactone acylase